MDGAVGPDTGVGDDGGGDAMLTPAMVAMTPSSQDFGSVLTGAQSAEVSFDVSNLGGMSAGALSVALSGPDAAQFSISTDTCAGIPLGATATCAVKLRFIPTSSGAKTAALMVGGSPGGSVSATLSGTGLAPGELRITPASHDFGNVVSGGQSTDQTFTVTNMGTASTGVPSAVLSDSSNFTISMNNCSAALAGSATCTIKARFNPGSTGSKLSSLTVMATPGGAAPASLSGTGISPAALTLTPATQDLGSLVIGTQSSPFAFTVRNTGASPSGSITPTLASTDFTIASNGCTGTLAAGATCSISVQFSAAAPAGAKMATLSVAATPGGTAMATVTGTSITMGALTITPATHPFGNVLTSGMSAEQTFTVTNTGGSATTMPSTTLSDTTNFTLTMNNCGTALNAGASCTVKARFNPTTVAAHNATLQVTATTGGTAVSQLSGTGQAPATLSITPATRDFGPVVLGQSAGPLAFTISNVGNSATGTISAVVGDMTHYMVTSTCTTLAPGANCTASVTYTASGVAGAQNSTITVSSTPGGSVQGSLTAQAITVGSLSISPTSPPAFASTVEGGTGSTQVFTITNMGGSGTGIPSVGFATATSDFTITDNQCLAALSPAGMCTVTVRFNPASAGSLNANLRVSATPGGTVSAMVSGVGLRKAALSLTPPVHDFGTLATGMQSPFTTFTVTNTGEVASGTVAVTLASSPSDFSIDGGTNTCTAPLAGGVGCTVRVRFTAGTVGAKSNVLQANAGAGVSTSATLSGTAASPALLSISTGSVDFGGVVAGTSSAPTTVTITNVGGSPTGSLAGSLTGNQFTMTDGCSGMSLPPAGTCAMVVRCAPTSSGTKGGSVAVTGSPGGMVSATLGGSGLAWGGAALVENNTGDVLPPQVAIDGAGNAFVVWNQSDGTRYNIWANRYAAGSGWGGATLLETDNLGDAFWPRVAVDGAGNAIAVWQQSDGTRDNIWAARYAGGFWSVKEPIETDNAGQASVPQVVMDGPGNAFAAWYQFDGQRHNVWANRFTPTGGWGTAVLVENDNTGTAVFSQISTDSSGNAVIVWRQHDGVRDNILANRYVPGTGWGTAVLIETSNLGNANYPQVVMDGLGNAIAVWYQSDGTRDNIWANRYVAGSGWGSAVLIETDNAGGAFDPQVATDGSGNAIVVWRQNDGTRDNIWSNRYLLGSGWGTAALVETDNVGGGAAPQVAMDGRGNAWAVWGQFYGGRSNVLASRYVPGLGWATPTPLESVGGLGGESAHVASNASGKSVAVWRHHDGSRNNDWANMLQ